MLNILIGGRLDCKQAENCKSVSRGPVWRLSKVQSCKSIEEEQGWGSCMGSVRYQLKIFAVIHGNALHKQPRVKRASLGAQFSLWMGFGCYWAVCNRSGVPLSLILRWRGKHKPRQALNSRNALLGEFMHKELLAFARATILKHKSHWICLKSLL